MSTLEKPGQEPQLAQITAALLPWSEYLLLDRLAEGNPHIFQLQHKRQFLTYFGSWHSYDVHASIGTVLTTTWNEFISQQETIANVEVLIEGGLRPLEDSAELAMVKHAEFGLITYLADKSGVNVLNADVDETVQREELSKLGYSQDQIQYYFFLIMAYQYVHLPEGHQPDFHVYMNESLQRDKRVSNWNGYDFSLEHMYALHQQFFGKEFELSDFAFMETLLDHHHAQYFTQKLKLDLIYIRDAGAVQKILARWAAGKNLFVVFGATHAFIQEPALKHFIQTG